MGPVVAQVSSVAKIRHEHVSVAGGFVWIAAGSGAAGTGPETGIPDGARSSHPECEGIGGTQQPSGHLSDRIVTGFEMPGTTDTFAPRILVHPEAS